MTAQMDIMREMQGAAKEKGSQAHTVR